jgi:hypothetical protein
VQKRAHWMSRRAVAVSDRRVCAHFVRMQSLFVHPTDDYDFVVQLEPAALPRYFQNIVADPAVWGRKGKYANAALESSEEAVTVRPGFDPAQMFVDDLKVGPLRFPLRSWERPLSSFSACTLTRSRSFTIRSAATGSAPSGSRALRSPGPSVF